jgi:hypothetical protein
MPAKAAAGPLADGDPDAREATGSGVLAGRLGRLGACSTGEAGS